MGLIPQDKIELVKDANDIVDVVSGYVSLKKTGASFKACCPFHTEKTPSFVVSPAKQIWRCFGCGIGGNVFGFVEKAEHMSFAEAVRFLAERRGISIEYTDSGKPELRDQLLKLNELAAKYYKYVLESETGRAARYYLSQRGINAESLARWNLGFAQDSWDAFLKYAKTKGYTEQLIESAGLIIKNEQRGSYYDRFRNRIVFPVQDRNGKYCAFGARVTDKSLPKYLNSPETQVYVKSRILYGWPQAKAAVSESNTVIIVEGYMDVVMPHQYGVSNVVASMGTSLTKEQSQQIKRYAENVKLCYDLDKAGINASIRGIDVLIEEGLNVSVVVMPQGCKDPDELLVKKGKDAFLEAVNNAKDIVEFWLEAEKTSAGTELSGKIAVVAKMKPVINKVANELRRKGYIETISRKLGLEERVVEKEFSKEERSYSAAAVKGQANPAARERVCPPAEKELLTLILNSAEAAGRVCAELLDSDFTDNINAVIFSEIKRNIAERGVLDHSGIAAALAGEAAEAFTALSLDEREFAGQEKAEKDLVRHIMNNRIINRLKELEPEVKKVGRSEYDKNLVNEYYQLLRRLKGMKK